MQQRRHIYGMERLWMLIICLIVLASAVPGIGHTQATDDGTGKDGSALDFRAVWVSTVLNLDYPSAGTTDAAALKAQADEILDSAAAMGCNAVILQVRPCADALYASAYFPWSRYLTGEAGTAPDDGFDPLQYWLLEAHERGLELHAWINPYRITKNTGSDRVSELSELPEGHPARENPGWVIAHGGDFYFDPGLPQVRGLIVDAAVEIVENYNVDGIHLDDYFYPATDFADAGTYEALAEEGQSLDDWRRENVNALIKALDEALHAANPDISFGASPFGIWANASTDPAGSATAGGEAYTQHYADTRLWVQEEWLDYIAPQIYWEFGHKAADYQTLVDWWADTVRGTDVKLYIGHAVYRIGDQSQSSAWQSPEQLRRQLIYNLGVPEVDGSIFFRWGSFTDDIAKTLDEVLRINAAYITDMTPEKGQYELGIHRPERDITTTLDAYYVGGSSDTGMTLLVNGEPVYDRSASGFWGTLVELEYGENVITVCQDDTTQTRIITRIEAQDKLSVGSSYAITYAYPLRDTYLPAGSDVTLTCTAPIGAVVKVKVGDANYRMQPTQRISPDASQYVLTDYTLTLPLDEELDGQCLVYTMTAGAHISRVQAGMIAAAPDPAGTIARVTAPAVYTYPEATTRGGPSGELCAGMVDRITEISGSWVKLGIGQWVQTDGIDLEQGSAGLSGGTWTVGEDGIERLHFPGNGSAYAVYDDAERILHLRLSPTLPAEIGIPAGSLFSVFNVSDVDLRMRYSLHLRDDAELGGFWVEADDSGVTLCCRPKKEASDGDQPLDGIAVVVDAGHGGAESGALGLLGKEYPEKAVNLQTALLLKDKLEALGADVTLTRTEDVTMSLEERVQVSRRVKPDLFISVHANSMSENVDCGNTRGFGVYYYAPVSAEAAASVYASLCNSLEDRDIGLHQENFYVCRTAWAPAILLEAAFMPNPRDFESLKDAESREAFAEAAAEAVASWFKRK
ncbi:MAG: hypothetical protein E7463_06950 [Ruminococcaceae bacterium]|nr:hypothetical protein [Oscillospiraceae bacterium]